jgi:hypothetical protein
MASFNKFNQFVEDLAKKVHNLGTSGDSLKIALTNTAPTSSNAVLADITEISYTNCSSRAVTISASAQSGGTYKLTCTDVVLTASGTVGPFQYVVLYNDTPTSPADPLIGYWNYGSAVTLASSDTFTIDFDGTNGVLQLA